MPTSTYLTITLILLPTLTFGLLYPEAIRRLPRLDSSYPKPDPTRRLLAASVDTMMLVSVAYLARGRGSPGLAVAGAAYVLGRDAVAGRSVGKFLFGLVVVGPETGRPCSIGQSLARNIPFIFPGVNLIAAVLEARTARRDPLGYRLGDLLARTQVVDGFGAKDLIAEILDWISPPSRVPRRGRRPAVGT